MSGILLIRDLAVVLAAAGAAGWLCQRAGLSVIVGYLVAGAIIGPFTPPVALVADVERVQTLAQLGLVFLIFSVGMNLNISRLRRLGLSIALATVIAALLVLNGCRLAGLAFGWTLGQGLFLAGMLMVSSSAIISKVLDELHHAHERSGQMALGMTVLEDVVAVAMLTLLTSVSQLGAGSSAAVLPVLGGLGAFVVLVVLLSLLIVPKLLTRLGRGTLPEIRTLAVTSLLLLLAWVAVEMGYSLALGAFVLGAIVGSTRHKGEVETVFEGVRHIFGAVFFVAIGMLVDFRLLAGAWPLVIAVTGLALVLRPVAAAIGLVAVGNTTRDGLRAGLALTPLGEFTFVIAQLGVGTGALTGEWFPVAVGASLLTSLAAPVLTRRADRITDWVLRAEPERARKWILFYHDWLSRLRRQGKASIVWRLTRKRFLQVALLMFSISAVILLAVPAFEWVQGRVRRDWPFPHGLAVLFWTVTGLVALGPLIALWRNLSALALILAEGATQGAQRAWGLRPLLAAAFRAVSFAVLAAWLVALLPTGPSVLGALAVVLGLLAIVAVVFRRRLVRLQSRLEIELGQQLKRASHAASASAWASGLMEPSSDWNLGIDEVVLPADSMHVGRSLGQTQLRQLSGCSVVGIDRQGQALVNPRADTVLYPRDRLLLLGPAEHLEQAGRLLASSPLPAESPRGFEELTMETVRVPRDSPLAGRALMELDLIGRTGAQIGAIRGGGGLNSAPAGSDRFAAGDDLLVLGTPDQIERLRSALAPDFSLSAEPGTA